MRSATAVKGDQARQLEAMTPEQEAAAEARSARQWKAAATYKRRKAEQVAAAEA